MTAKKTARQRATSDRRTGATKPPQRSREGAEPFSVEYLRQRLDYDPATGLFTFRRWSGWPDNVAARLVGKPALTTPRDDGHLCGLLDGVRLRAARVAFAMDNGSWPEPGCIVSHRNGVPSDNRAANLRSERKAMFQQDHRRRRTGGGRLGVPGVSYKRGAYAARISDGLRQVHLGTFSDVREAVAARYVAEQERGYAPGLPLEERQRQAVARVEAAKRGGDLSAMRGAESAARRSARPVSRKPERGPAKRPAGKAVRDAS